MGLKLGSMTLGSLFKKPETTQYPAQTKPVPKGLKGHISIDIEVCILCGICEKACPAHAITVEKTQESWTIDPFRCVQCGSCVRVCPKSCLHMETSYAPSATEKSNKTFTKPQLTEDEKAAKEAKEAEKAAKIKAALEAKKKRESEG